MPHDHLVASAGPRKKGRRLARHRIRDQTNPFLDGYVEQVEVFGEGPGEPIKVGAAVIDRIWRHIAPARGAELPTLRGI